MDNEIIETADAVDTSSFATEIIKSFVISAASTAGFMTGMMVVGYANKKIAARKAAKKAAQTEPETAK